MPSLLISVLLLPGCGRQKAWDKNMGLQRSPGATEHAVVFPLKVSADRRYLTDQQGTPFLIHGDAAWSLIARLEQADVEAYLEDRRQRGFNLVIVNLIEHQYADHAPRNAYGQPPFTRAGDFSTPNEAYFAYADWAISLAAAKGLVVLLAPAYLGYGGGPEGWYQEMLRNGPATLRAYGQYVGHRYRRFSNIMWLEGGDYSPPRMELVDAVVEGIKSEDTQHLHTAHWSPETSSAELQVAGWLDLTATYTYQPAYLRSLEDYNRPERRPHFLVESAYEEEHGSTPASLRAQAYYSLLTGAVGQVFGHRLVWKFDRGWKAALASPGSLSMGHVRSLFAPRPWTTLVPDQKGEVLIAGQGARGSTGYAVLARSADGNLAIAYLPTPRAVTVDLGKLSGPVGARWYDPASGTFAPIAGAPWPATGQREFSPPASNSAGDPDWVLLFETQR